MAEAVNSPADLEQGPDVGPVPDEQPNAPYLEAVVAYAFRGPARYHVPGHKGGPGADPGVRKAIGVDALAADVPQDIHGIDLGPSPTPYERAERLAAQAFGAERSWFLTNGATQGNHALCLALAPLGTKIVAQRNSHTSIVDGLVLSGGIPSFVAPEYDAELGITHAVTPDALAVALREAPDASAAFIVSPTYYGMAADVAGLAEVAHRADVPLVVDQSWGPHFGFHEKLPPTALSQGADAMLTSTHKIAGSLTQSAMLHVGNRSGRDRIDVGAVGRAIRLLRSTSPSSLLLAGAVRPGLDAIGRERDDRLVGLAVVAVPAHDGRGAVERLVAAQRRLSGLAQLDHREAPAVAQVALTPQDRDRTADLVGRQRVQRVADCRARVGCHGASSRLRVASSPRNLSGGGSRGARGQS